MSRKNLVVLTGAGISAESGIKTFRDSDGLWEGYDVREVATPGAWKRNAALVLDFYNMRRRNVLEAQPNSAHIALASLQDQYNVTIVTQNIDDLHERAGSQQVLHLHGEILKMRSERNKSLVYDILTDMYPGQVAADGAQLRPHIVWFEEPVPLISKAADIMKTADIFLVVGTSLAVYPAAGLLNYVPESIPKFIIDKNIPYTSNLYNLETIEKPATEGMVLLIKLLRYLQL
jgi:NAD-dependent deacetylase